MRRNLWSGGESKSEVNLIPQIHSPPTGIDRHPVEEIDNLLVWADPISENGYPIVAGMLRGTARHIDILTILETCNKECAENTSWGSTFNVHTKEHSRKRALATRAKLFC